MIEYGKSMTYEKRMYEQAKEAENDPLSELFLRDVGKIQRKYQKEKKEKKEIQKFNFLLN